MSIPPKPIAPPVDPNKINEKDVQVLNNFAKGKTPPVEAVELSSIVDRLCGGNAELAVSVTRKLLAWHDQSLQTEITKARMDEVFKVLPSVGITGDVNADRTITTLELWSAMVKRKKELEAQLKGQSDV